MCRMFWARCILARSPDNAKQAFRAVVFRTFFFCESGGHGRIRHYARSNGSFFHVSSLNRTSGVITLVASGMFRPFSCLKIPCDITRSFRLGIMPAYAKHGISPEGYIPYPALRTSDIGPYCYSARLWHWAIRAHLGPKANR